MKWVLLLLSLRPGVRRRGGRASRARRATCADESELEFELGADRYKAGDFRGALEHFLASNRLVANRNVVFNIARTYEQLSQNADAYRYYNQALEGETDRADARPHQRGALTRHASTDRGRAHREA